MFAALAAAAQISPRNAVAVTTAVVITRNVPVGRGWALIGTALATRYALRTR